MLVNRAEVMLDQGGDFGSQVSLLARYGMVMGLNHSIGPLEGAPLRPVQTFSERSIFRLTTSSLKRPEPGGRISKTTSANFSACAPQAVVDFRPRFLHPSIYSLASKGGGCIAPLRRLFWARCCIELSRHSPGSFGSSQGWYPARSSLDC